MTNPGWHHISHYTDGWLRREAAANTLRSAAATAELARRYPTEKEPTMTTTSDRIAADYGVRQTSPIEDGYNFDRDNITLAELAARGGRITRVRLLTESWPGGRYADVSYIHGVLGDGTPVRLTDQPGSGPLWGAKGVKARMIEWAKESGVFAKSLGLLDENNWSILY